MMDVGWSDRRVVRQLGRSDCVTSRRDDHHIVRNARVQPTASSVAIQTQVAPSLGAPVSSRTIRRRLAEGHLESRYPLRVLPLTPTHRPSVWSGAAHEKTGLQRNETRWGVIAYNTRSPLVLIRGTMTAQRYVHDILQSHVLPLKKRLPGAIFQQDNAWPHTARGAQDCPRTVTTLPWPARSPDLAPIDREDLGSFETANWASHEFKRTRDKTTANMERNVPRHHTELVCLNARSYSSCIGARGGSTGY
ncbi:transposable element Tcb2 transposase [Trichonephila clavipes]|nr:transposable element Tcb2 transposase [Trichonephila clavipes]